MSYLTAWLSLIGPGELAFVAAVLVLAFIADRAILWHDKHPWQGVLRRKD